MFVKIYMYFSIFQKILYFPWQNFGVWKNSLKFFFKIARNNIISVEPTKVEHRVKCETILMSPAGPITMVGQSKKANFPCTGCLEKRLRSQGHILHEAKT